MSGENDLPITHGGTDRGGKLCKCSKCGVIEFCTPSRDFYTTEDPNGPLLCEDCITRHAVAVKGWAEVAALRKEIQMLKKSRAAAVNQEQINRNECNRLRQELADVRTALEESVKLQTHYAKLINMHDGGERMGFLDAEAWMDRLRETGKL